MVVDGKLRLLNKMIKLCYDEHEKKHNLKHWIPVLMGISEAKFYEDIESVSKIKIKTTFASLVLKKVLCYKCQAYNDGKLVAECTILFGERL